MASACHVSPAELECAICCELLLDPRNLECSHTFCMKCLILLLQTKQDSSVDCPLCRKVTSVEEGDLSSLEPNVEIQTAVKKLEKKNDSLKERVEDRMNVLLEYMSLINDVEDTVNTSHDQATNAIEAAFGDGLRKLTERNDELIRKCLQFKREQMSKLNAMRETSGDSVSRISSTFEKISEDAMLLLEGESLAVHESAECALRNMLDQDEPDASDLSAIAEHSANVKFKRLPGQSEMDMGSLLGTECLSDEDSTDLKTRFVGEIQVENDKVSGMVMMPNGRVALGFRNGGIQYFNKDGAQEKVLQHVQVWALAAIPDGRFVVRDRENCILLFTGDLERQSPTFNTMSWQEGGQGDIEVDTDWNIYVSYWRAMKIEVFSEDGGDPIREIPCNDYVPSQFCVGLLDNNILVQDGPTVRVIDESGVLKSEVTRGGVLGYPALECLCGGFIMIVIAWVNDKSGLVTIKRYPRLSVGVGDDDGDNDDDDDDDDGNFIVKDYKVDSAWLSRCFIKVSDEGFIAFYRNSKIHCFQTPPTDPDDSCCIL